MTRGRGDFPRELQGINHGPSGEAKAPRTQKTQGTDAMNADKTETGANCSSCSPEMEVPGENSVTYRGAVDDFHGCIKGAYGFWRLSVVVKSRDGSEAQRIGEEEGN